MKKFIKNSIIVLSIIFISSYLSIPAFADTINSLPQYIISKDEGTTLTARTTSINYVGAGVTATNTAGSVTVSIPGGITSAITSINSDSTAAQTLSTGTSGTNFGIVDNGTGTHTFNLPIASATNTGKLSSTDWNTFNGKESILSFTTPLSRSTNTISILQSNGSTNGYLSSTDWTTFNNKQNALTLGNLTDAGTDGITVTSGTGAVIGSGTSFAQNVSDSTHNGYLSSTDWNIFNGKESALTFSTGLTRSTNTITANLSTGISGGQTAIGGTASGENLLLQSTTNVTKGYVGITTAVRATPNFGSLSIGNGAFDGTTSGFFTGSSNGTFLAINAASGYLGDLVNFQVAGAKRFRVDKDGKVYTGGFLYGGEATTDTLTLGSNSSGTNTNITIGLNNATPLRIFGTGQIKMGTSSLTTSSTLLNLVNDSGFNNIFAITSNSSSNLLLVTNLGQFTSNSNVNNQQSFMYSFNGTNGTNSQTSVVTPYKFSGTIDANFSTGDEADFFHFTPTFENSNRTNLIVKVLNVVPTFTNYNTAGSTAYGLYMDLGTNPTNAWGLYINQATTKNYLAGSLYLGATTAVGSEIFRVNGQSYYDGALVLKDKITTYNNIATAGNGVPAIYGYGRLTTQTAAAASVATYTVSGSDGSFEVSANVNVTASTTHSFTVTCTYTDETNTSQTLTLNFSQVSGTIGTAITNVTGTGAYEGVPVHIRAKASTSITIATTGTFTSVTYNVEGVIKKTA